MKKFEGKTVLVTGASRGIGAAIARAFAKEGAFVIVNYLQNHTAAEQVASACIELGGDAWAIQADVTSETAVNQMIDQVVLEAGKIDVVVNNAFKPYVFDPDQRKLAWEVKWEDYQAQLDGALRSTHYVCQAVLPVMKKQSQGSIINVTSNLVVRPIVPYHEYNTAKTALTGYTRNLAVELGSFGIRVNCVAPGLVYPTDASKHTKEEVKEMIIAQTPLRRLAAPEDIAGPVMFLASEWSQFMTGQTLFVDGGLVMG
ncbi:3-oxoacyl-ACP reductase [Bacillus sp. ISL-40]|uniref:3-oxoacyl-ACP reductase n=1 Tax=unclassified Bacillus (in: firmicutes) TaxID=185979 RepID=UPI001BEACE32|nr:MULTISPECIES: 3-oxoacyl-ACP reductase [unclassified Bacillus (in: firmicutes)]MBT2700296.1 3-oxoacyl-ACP reductase [Bacillus sp. ISL-40]MBT2725161.1 3-oxoacyl-ACP reductase [Bacillus sp. ISL-46]MBT2742852.1 3-oxoacyl-ACP reductase [Bacillus sp. ISL-77]